MSQKFTPLAQSRASYYCKGSPVHFVMVELFRMEGTGATVVTLTFKNLFSRPLVSFTAYFRCKNKYGEVVVEDSFTYDNVYAGKASASASTMRCLSATSLWAAWRYAWAPSPTTTERLMTCGRCPAVALPALRPAIAARWALDARGGCRRLALLPAARSNNAGRGIRYTAKCGVEKVLMQAAVRDAQTAAPARPSLVRICSFARAGQKRPPAAPAGSGAAACSMLVKARMPRARRTRAGNGTARRSGHGRRTAGLRFHHEGFHGGFYPAVYALCHHGRGRVVF